MTEEFLTVLEFFAVDDKPTAVLFHAVKGGVSLPQPLISAIFKVLLSLFLLTHFFIVHFTLPLIMPQHIKSNKPKYPFYSFTFPTLFTLLYTYLKISSTVSAI